MAEVVRLKDTERGLEEIERVIDRRRKVASELAGRSSAWVREQSNAQAVERGIEAADE
jgi:hypothetical protein